jgi:hypothetical protein
MPVCSCGKTLSTSNLRENCIECTNCVYAIHFDLFYPENNYIYFFNRIENHQFEIFSSGVFSINKGYRFVIKDTLLFNIEEDVDPPKVIKRVIRLMILL